MPFELTLAEIAPHQQLCLCHFKPQVEKLDDLGYDCFLLVYKALLKLNGGCWRGSYELSAISNTLCVRKKYKLHDALLSPFNAVSAGTGSGGSSRASAAGKRARGQQQRDRLDEW